MRFTLVLALSAAIAGCTNASPTEPASAAGAVTGILSPTPAPPGPTTSPAPSPAPSPVPPAPPVPGPSVDRYDASVSYAYWFGPDRTPLFGETFTIEVWAQEVWMHNTRLPIVHRGDGILIAREGPMIEVELRFSSGEWILRGGKGDARGTFARRP